jgi:hypothetical protein
VAREGFDDTKFVPYEQRPQTFNGVPVLQRQQALLPHPHPSHGGKLVPTRGVTQVLLENGFEFHECDYNCGKTSENGRSLLSHLTSHNTGRRDPDYPAEVLEKIVTVAREERTRGFRNYCERTAMRLNAAGLTMLSGQPFNAENISHLYNSHKDRFPERRRGPGRPRKSPVPDLPEQQRVAAASPSPSPAPSPRATRTQAPARTMTASTPAGLIAQIEHGLAEARRNLKQVEDYIFALVTDLNAQAPADPEVVEKARLYDEMRAKFMS